MALLIDYNMEKNLLRNVKIFRLFFVQFLIIGFFANSLLPQACFCGEACLHGLQGTANKRQNFLFHTRCLGTQCKSCNLEDVQTFKASNAANSTEQLITLNTTFILPNFSNYQFNINFIKIFSSRLNTHVKVQTPQTYLQNLSLLLWFLFRYNLHIINPERSQFWNHLFHCSETGTNYRRRNRHTMQKTAYRLAKYKIIEWFVYKGSPGHLFTNGPD